MLNQILFCFIFPWTIKVYSHMASTWPVHASAEVGAFLRCFTFIQSYEVPSTMLLCDLISPIITRDLENSGHNIFFTHVIWSRYIPSSKPLTMDLLSIINQGNWWQSIGDMHLQPAHGVTPHVDLNVIVNSRLFVIPNLTIQNSQVMLFFGE